MNPQRNQLKLMIDIERAKLDAEEIAINERSNDLTSPTTAHYKQLRLSTIHKAKYRLTMLQTKVNAGKYD